MHQALNILRQQPLKLLCYQRLLKRSTWLAVQIRKQQQLPTQERAVKLLCYQRLLAEER
jgi:hypothetical protein